MAKKAISEEQKAAIINSVGSGLSTTELTRLAKVSSSTVQGHRTAYELGLHSYTGLLNHRAQQKGFRTAYAYNKLSKKEKEKVKQKRRNFLERLHDISRIVINEKLTEIGKDRKWLSSKIEINDGILYKYLTRRCKARETTLKSFFDALGLNYKNLETLTNREIVLLSSQDLDLTEERKLYVRNRIRSMFTYTKTRSYPNTYDSYKCGVCNANRAEKHIVGHFKGLHIEQYLFS